MLSIRMNLPIKSGGLKFSTRNPAGAENPEPLNLNLNK